MASENEILGISGHLDIEDVFRGFDELIDKLEAVGVNVTSLRVKMDSLRESNDAAYALADALNKTAESSAKAREEISNISVSEAFKGGETLDSIREKFEENAKVAQQTSDEASAAYQQQELYVQKLNQALQELAQQRTSIGANGTGYEELTNILKALLPIATNAADSLDDLAKAEVIAKENAEQAKETLDAFNSNTVVSALTSIKEKIDAVKDSFKETKESLSNFGSTIASSVIEPIQNATSKLTDWATGHGKLKEGIDTFTAGIEKLPIPIKTATSGIGEMVKGMWAMCQTPIGRVLAAITFALQAMFQWFTKSAEGQKQFAKISAYVGSILSSLTDIVVKVGKYIFNAFTSSNGAMHDFASGVVTTLKTAVQMGVKLLTGLGKTLKGLWQMLNFNFEEGWNTLVEAGNDLGSAFIKSVENIGNVLKTAAAGIKGLVNVATDGISALDSADIMAALRNMKNTAKEAGQLALEQKETEIAISEAKKKEAELDAQIAESREKIYTLTGKERLAEIEKLKIMQQQKYDERIKQQEKLYQIQKRTNELHASTLADEERERQLNIQVLQLKAQQAAATRMTTRLEESTKRTIVNEGKKEAKKDEKVRKAQERMEEVVLSTEEARIKREREAEEKVAEARIAAMEDGYKKTIAERKRAQEAELDAIEQHRKDAIEKERQAQKKIHEAEQAVIKAKGGKTSPFVFNANAEEVVTINAQYDDLVDFTKQRQLNEQRRQELESMREYLRQYGDAEQQKLAITEEYEEKINNAVGANDPYKAASLMEERDKRLQDIGTKDVFKDIDWEGVFENLEGHSTQYLEALRSKLQAILQSGKVTDVTQIESLQSKINDINALIAQQPSLFKFISDAQIEHNRRIQEAVDAQERLNVAKQKEVEEAQALAEAQNQVFNSEQWKAFGNKDLKAGELNTEAARQTLDNIGKTKGINSPEYTEFAKIISTLIAAEGKLRKAREDVAKATDKATDAEDGAQETGRGKWNRIRSNIENSAAFANVSAAPELLNSLGFGEAAEQATKGLQGFNDGMNAVTDFMSGNYIGALQKGISAITNLGESFGLWSNSNVAEKEAEIEERQNANKELVKALKDLTDAFKNADLANGIKTFQQAQGVLQTQIRNAQEAADAKGDEYSGHHSTNYYSGEFGRQMRELYKRTFGTTEGLIDGGQGYDDFVYLDPAKLREMRMKDPEAWASAIGALRDADKANFGVADMFVSLVDDFGSAMEDLERQWKETITGLSFDTFKSNFASAIKDMSKEAKDWSNDIDDVLRENVANYIQSHYTSTDTSGGKEVGRLTKLYDKIAEYTESAGIDAREAAEIRAEYLAIQQDAATERDRIYEMLDLDDVSSSEAQGTINGIKSISDDTANEIVGRLTAMQISVERNSIILEEQLAQQGAQVTSLQSIEAYTANINGNVVNITENVRTIVESQNAMNMHLANISANTEVLPGMYREITRMRTKIDTL